MSNVQDVVQARGLLSFKPLLAVVAVCCVAATSVFATGQSLAAPGSCEAADLYAVSGNPSGLPTSPECTFSSIAGALEYALEREPVAATRVVLAGATASEPAVFRHERFPLVVPAEVTVTTVDDPDVGGEGLNSANYVVNFTGRATHALELGGGLKGVTLQNERARNATTMLVCSSGSALIEAVTLDGTNRRGGAIGEGMRLGPNCELDASGLRVRRFAGDGVIVEEGADMTLAASKVHGNGGDGIVIRGLASISTSEIAFNGDDGVLVVSSAGSSFVGNNVRDNGGNGFEVRTSGVSFLGNRIHNNSRSTGWDEAQMLFVGTAPTGVQYWVQMTSTYVTAYPVGDPEGDCTIFNEYKANWIYSYNIDDEAEYSVGIYAEQVGGAGAYVWADNNRWVTGVYTENVDEDGYSFVDANTSCGVPFFFADPYPGPPVE